MPDDLSGDAIYERDFFLWTIDQADRLRRAARPDNHGVDWENLAEEIESLGRRDRREIQSRLNVIFEHLLKLAYAAAAEPRVGWQETVNRERREVELVLNDSPSLRRTVADWQASDKGRIERLVARRFGEYEEAGSAQLLMSSDHSELIDRVLDDDFIPHPAD